MGLGCFPVCSMKKALGCCQGMVLCFALLCSAMLFLIPRSRFCQGCRHMHIVLGGAGAAWL